MIEVVRANAPNQAAAGVAFESMVVLEIVGRA